MMEYAIAVSKVGEMPVDPRTLCPASWRRNLPAGPLRALYFGSEFCEDLLPVPAKAARYCRWASDVGLEAVLLTPPVRDRGLQRVAELYRGLRGAGWKPAVVFNDWGVFHCLRQSHPQIRLHAGRVINRGLRDPRLVGQLASRASSPRGERIRNLLRHHGVVAVETDPDLQGGFLGPDDGTLRRVLHLPYTFVASGRNCLVRADDSDAENCFIKGIGKPCHRPCREEYHEVRRPDVSVPLFRSGNTLFFEAPDFLAQGCISQADRIVLHDRPRS